MRIAGVGSSLAILSFALLGVSTLRAAAEAPTTLQKSFTAGKVTVDGFQGTLTITTAAPGSAVTVRATGKTEVMKHLDVRQDASGVLIRLETRSNSVWWPWSVLDWSQRRDDDIVMTIGAPKGTEFDLDDVVGRVSAGDLDAPLRFGGAGSGTAKFGRVARARVEVAGSMSVTLGDSQGPVDVEISGSGDVKTGAATQARLEISGSGTFQSGALTGGLDADVEGSGDATVGSVNGPVSIDISGSSNVIIKGGRADPFNVSIQGAGDVDFGGEAVNPTVSISGSGNVTVASMSGSLKQDIQGSGEFSVKAPIKVPASAPPVSAQPVPVPPAQPSAPTP